MGNSQATQLVCYTLPMATRIPVAQACPICRDFTYTITDNWAMRGIHIHCSDCKVLVGPGHITRQLYDGLCGACADARLAPNWAEWADEPDRLVV